jgi:hypothetical protein
VSLPGHKPGDDLYDELVCMISLLAPVYALYASHHLDTGAVAESWLRFPPLPPGFEPHELTLASLIEAAFGATRLHRDTLSSPVPDLRPPGMLQGRETRLVDCLFTPNRY